MMSEIEIKDMLKDIKGKVESLVKVFERSEEKVQSIAQDVKVLVSESERKKISNTFDKVFKKEDV
jgi:hypothetical protein